VSKACSKGRHRADAAKLPTTGIPRRRVARTVRFKGAQSASDNRLVLICQLLALVECRLIRCDSDLLPSLGIRVPTTRRRQSLAWTSKTGLRTDNQRSRTRL